MVPRKNLFVIAFLIAMYVCVSFLILDKLEKKINPVGWDLQTYDNIQALEKQTKLRGPDS